MIQKMFKAFGTVNTVTVYNNSEKTKTVLAKAEKLIKDMDFRWSVFRAESEISEINRHSGTEFVSVKNDTFDIIKKSVEYSELTEGLFDITVQPLVEAYLSGEKGNTVPENEVKRCRELVNYRDITFNETKVKLRKRGQKISLGAIAKGYAADEINELFEREGVEDYIANLGGTVSVKGGKRTVGLQHPLKETGQVLGTLTVKDKILVTSGAYERSYYKDGEFHHHILDSRTGKSSKSDLLSVTLVGDNGALLDALATAVFVMGLEAGYQLIQKLKLEAVFVASNLNIYATNGLKGSLKITTERSL